MIDSTLKTFILHTAASGMKFSANYVWLYHGGPPHCDLAESFRACERLVADGCLDRCGAWYQAHETAGRDPGGPPTGPSEAHPAFPPDPALRRVPRSAVRATPRETQTPLFIRQAARKVEILTAEQSH